MRPEEQLELLASDAVDVVTREELLEKLKRGVPLRIKYGADPSAPDLHLGHSVPMRRLKRFQELGHKIVFIIGDFTGRIGDPSGRSKTRPMLSEEQIRQNGATYAAQVGQILDVSQCEIVYNSSWFSEIDAAGVLRLASHYTVARMLERDDFCKRMAAETPISVVEMLYPLVQAYDSVAVKADIELGGTDQFFNFLVGRDIMRAYGLEPQVVMTWPLLVGLDGHDKMSKSLGNYVGISEPPGEMFGKLMSIPDALLPQYLLLVCEWPKERVAEAETGLKAGTVNPRELKDEMARTVVATYHGEAAGEEASAEFRRVFSKHELPAEMPELKVAYLTLTETVVVSDAITKQAGITLSEDVALGETPGEGGPSTVEVKPGKGSLATIIARAGMASSNSEARRLIKQGAVSINDETVAEEAEEAELHTGDVLRVGKRRFARIVIEGED